MANKADLIDKIYKKTDFTKKSTQKFLDVFLEAIQEHLQNGSNIRLTDFGSFKVKQRKEREGRNPYTGEKITIPASRVVKFSPGKALIERVQE